MIDRRITITLIPRGDGGLRISSDDMPGLILSGPDPVKVMRDLWPALVTLAAYRSRVTLPTPEETT